MRAPFPSVTPLAWATGTAAAAGDNILVAAPGAGKQIVILFLMLQNEGSAATTLILKHGPAARLRCLAQNQGDGLALALPPNREWAVGEDAALVLNLSGANSCGYTVGYVVEAV